MSDKEYIKILNAENNRYRIILEKKEKKLDKLEKENKYLKKQIKDKLKMFNEEFKKILKGE